MLHKQLFPIIGILTLIISLGICQAVEPNTQPGSKTTKALAVFKMGDFRLINNNWGAQELKCKDQQYEIFIEKDKTFGWKFNRGHCGGDKGKPDYPEVEFGIHPFGVGSPLATSPDSSSTTILPLQIKDINSASIKVDGMDMTLQNSTSFNLNFEMWFCEEHPVTGNHKNAYAELIVFWAWQDGRWGCDQEGTVKAGDGTYRLCHQSDNWGGWRYYQFRLEGGSNKQYKGKLDIKAFLDWLVKNRGFSKDLWVSRFEIGTEIDDETSGTVKMKNITVEVNGKTKSPQFDNPVNVSTPKISNNLPYWNSYTIPAYATIEAVNLNGERTILHSGTTSIAIAKLCNNLKPGIYVMSLRQNGIIIGKSMVVPVIR